jgi:hypothetical protein
MKNDNLTKSATHAIMTGKYVKPSSKVMGQEAKRRAVGNTTAIRQKVGQEIRPKLTYRKPQQAN